MQGRPRRESWQGWVLLKNNVEIALKMLNLEKRILFSWNNLIFQGIVAGYNAKAGKGQSSSQFPRRVVLKSVQTTGQLHSSPLLVRSCLKSCMLGFSIMWTKDFQMSKLGLEKAEEPEIKLPAFTEKSREFQKNIYLCCIDYAKAFRLCGS